MRTVEAWVTTDDLDAFLAELADIGAEYGCSIQALDARYVAGDAHIETAVERAARAWDRGDAIADDRAMEVLLYAAGRRQIDRALEMGIDPDGPAVIVIDREGTGGDARNGSGSGEADAAAAVRALDAVEPRETVGSARDEDRIRAFFGIGEAETAATDAGLEALVCERVALLVVEK